jgi:gliding motility-associated-like protein
VTDNGTNPDNLTASETFNIVVAEANAAPVLDPIGDKNVDEQALLTFTATATDQDLPPQMLTFSLDAASITAGMSITSDGVFTWTPDEAQGGATYPVTITVTDNGTNPDNLTASETINITVVEVNVAPVLNPIGDKNVDEQALLTFTATATDQDLPPQTLTFSLDGASTALGMTLTSDGVFNWTPTESQGGVTYPVTITVTDDGTNPDNLTASETFNIVVAKANAAPVLDPIGDKNVDEQALLTFTATATDQDIPAQTLIFSLDAASITAGMSITSGGVFTWTPDETQGGATYPVTITVTDDGTNPDNLTASETFNIVVAEANVAPVLDPIGDKNVDEQALLTFTAIATDQDLPPQTLTFSLDAASITAGMSITSDGVFTWTPDETQGGAIYPVTITVTDNGTNPDNLIASETFNINVAEVNAAPVLDPIGDKNVDEQALLTFTATATDQDIPAQTLTFTLDAASITAGMSITSGGVFTWTPDETQGGATYPVTITVTDNGTNPDNLTASETFNITVAEVNVAPVIANVPATVTIPEMVPYSFTATATDSDIPVQTLTFSLSAGAPTGAAIDPSTGEFTWMPTEAQGPGVYTFDVIVSDGSLTDAQSITITVDEVNIAPVLADVPVSVTIPEMVVYSFTATATDEDLPANTLTFTLGVTAPTGAAIDPSTGVFTWTPTESQGPGIYTFDVIVSDGSLTDTQSIIITVDEVNVAPVLTNVPATVTIPEMAAYTITATATDSDIPVQTLTFSLSAGAPAGAAIDPSTGVFTWTPTELQGPGVYTFDVIVSDGSLTDTQSITITVDEVNIAPVLAAIGNQTSPWGSLVTFTATATDQDIPANTLTYSLIGAPAGAVIGSSSGVFTWTPNGTQPAGDYTFTVRVTDNGTPNLFDEEVITITLTKVMLTVTADPQTKVYGTANPTLTFQYSGFVNGDDPSVLTTAPTTATTVTLLTPVGTYPNAITVSGGLDDNYNFTYVAADFTVTSATLTITADPGTKIYGDALTFAGTEFTTSGLVNGDAVTTVNLTSTGSPAAAAIGTYPIIASAAVGTGLTNYTISYVPGILTVNQKALTITANNLVKTYGQTLTFAGTEFTTSGLVNTDAVTSVTLTSTGAAAAATVAGSPYPIVASAAVGTGLSNYTIGYVDGSLTVNPIALTITANSMTKNYGDVVTFTGTEFTTSGLVNTDAVTSVTLTSAGAAAAATVAGSPYPIVASAAVGTGLGNYTIVYVDGNLTVSPMVLTITATSRTKTYGETVTFAGTEFTAAGLINGDAVTSVTLTSAGAAATATVAGSPYAIVPSAAIGTGLGNYTIGYYNSTLTVTQRVLTVGGTFTANNKEYDGTTSATFTSNNLTLLTLVGSDNVILNTTPVFTSAGVGTGKLVTLTGLSITGPDAPNYTLSLTGLPTTTADITPKVLTIGGSFTVNNKVYDGTTAATIAINNLTLLTKVGSDDVALNAVAVFDDKAIGTGKTVTLTGSSLTGTDAGNYVLSLTGAPVTTADITPLSLTIGGTFTVNDKVYDATADATISSNFLTLLTIAGTDDVSLNAVAAFSDKVVGTGKTVRLTGSTLTGNDAANYTLSLVGAPETTADITVRELTIGGSFTANNKVYDGTTSATIMLNNLTLLTVAGTDEVTLNAVAVFDDVAVGTGKTVRLTGSTISGSDASNYSLSLTGSPTATATITEFGLTVTGVTADNKLYDGTTVATLNISGATLEGVIGTDVVILEATGVTGAFFDKTVGFGKTVVITGFTITGQDADKYSLTQPTATADITAINLTITGVTAGNKVYDGTTVAVLNTDNAAVEVVLAGDDVSLVSSGATGSFADKDIGLGKTVTTSGFALEGNDAVNYTLTQPTLTADITPAPLTISGVTANNKTYDGTTVATLNTGSASLVGVIGTDDISLITTDAIGAFADKNVGTGKPVTTSGFAISGASADNYTLTQPELFADITSKGLTITAHNLSKTYGTELIFAGTEFTVSGLVAGDPVPGVIISSDGAPALADVGTYPIVITGGSDSNYDYTYVDGVLTVGKADQVITFAEIPSGLRMTQDYTLDATASSGLPVSFEISNPNIASLDGNTLLINQDGTFTITAIQEGDQNWNPAPDVIQIVSTLPTFDKITSLFTPNHDGMNDYWYIPHLEDYGKLQVTVYNRYGQAVYKSDSYKNDWDGTWNGYPLPSASYYYIIRSSTKGIIKGVVNIVR